MHERTAGGHRDDGVHAVQRGQHLLRREEERRRGGGVGEHRGARDRPRGHDAVDRAAGAGVDDVVQAVGPRAAVGRGGGDRAVADPDDADGAGRVEGVLERDAQRLLARPDGAGVPHVPAGVDGEDVLAGAEQDVGHDVDEPALADGPDVEDGTALHGEQRRRPLEQALPGGDGRGYAGRGRESVAGVVAEVLERGAHQRVHRAVGRRVQARVEAEHRLAVVPHGNGPALTAEGGDQGVGPEAGPHVVELRDGGLDARLDAQRERLRGVDLPQRPDALELHPARRWSLLRHPPRP
nr:hypothetical protein [Serinibacter arcticus]